MSDRPRTELEIIVILRPDWDEGIRMCVNSWNVTQCQRFHLLKRSRRNEFG